VSQQINLFNPQFLKQKKYFSALMMLQSVAVLLAGLALFYGYALQQEAELARQAAASVQENAVQSERLNKFSAEFAPGAAQKQAEAELQEAAAAIAARETLLRQMQSGALSNAAGYSEYLRAFARQIVSGVWLTGVEIEEGAQSLTLKGNALQADLIPAFIGRLGAEPVLRGRQLESLSISQAAPASVGKSPAAPAYVAFRLSSSDLLSASAAGNESQGGGQ